jgi:hypothetical protein
MYANAKSLLYWIVQGIMMGKKVRTYAVKIPFLFPNIFYLCLVESADMEPMDPLS